MKALEKRIKPIIDVNESVEETMERFFAGVYHQSCQRLKSK